MFLAEALYVYGGRLTNAQNEFSSFETTSRSRVREECETYSFTFEVTTRTNLTFFHSTTSTSCTELSYRQTVLMEKREVRRELGGNSQKSRRHLVSSNPAPLSQTHFLWNSTSSNHRLRGGDQLFFLWDMAMGIVNS